MRWPAASSRPLWSTRSPRRALRTLALKGAQGKLRPLVCGSTLRRLVATTLCGFDRDLLRRVCGGAQCAVGASAGGEQLGHMLQVLIDRFPDCAVLQFDAICAFNNICRQRVLARVADVAPHLLAWATQWLSRRTRALLARSAGDVVSLDITAGLDQGDPLSPFFFAIALSLPEIQARLRELMRLTAGHLATEPAGQAASPLTPLQARWLP